MSIYNMPWKLVWNRLRGCGGREIDRFRGIFPPVDDENGSEAWIGSDTKALGATEENPIGCSEVMLPDGKREFLYRVIEQAPMEILGKKHIEKNGKCLGILVKLLDAQESFAMEAHPTRNVAKKIWNSEYGKEESWYILGTRDDVREPAFVYLGFKEGVTKERFAELYDKGDLSALEELCHKIQVKPGDAFMIRGGLPHALGAGCFALEVQEPSDIGVTPLPQSALAEYYRSCGCEMEMQDEGKYRSDIIETFVYEGRSREKNLEKWYIPGKIIRNGIWGKEVLLAGPDQTEYFSYTRLDVDGQASVRNTGFPQIAVVIDGEGSFIHKEGSMEVKKGDELFLPYNIPEASVKGKLSIIFCHPEGASVE